MEMKKGRFIVVFLLFLSISLGVYFLLSKIARDTKRKMLMNTHTLFEEALLADFNERIKLVKEFYTGFISANWPENEILVTTTEGVRTIANVDSIRKLPLADKIRILTETYLVKQNPIDPDTLNARFQQILQDRGITIHSGIRYTEVETGKNNISKADAGFFTTAYPLEECKSGVFDEIVVQAYVKIPFITLVEHSGGRIPVLLIVWMVLFVLVIIYFYHTTKKKVAQDEHAGTEQPRELLVLDEERRILTFNGHEVQLTEHLAQLMALFLDKPDYFLTKQEIEQTFWPKMDNSTFRMSQLIKRLRDTLKSTPEIKIETIPQVGYRLLIDGISLDYLEEEEDEEAI